MELNIFQTDLLIRWKKVAQCVNCRNDFQQYTKKFEADGYIKRRPHLLPCNHSICENCLFTKNTNGVNCSLCKKTFQYNKNSPLRGSFEINYYILGMLNYGQGLLFKDISYFENTKQKNEISSKDDLCIECNIATYSFCIQCDVPYCNRCFLAVHKCGKVLRDHVLSGCDQPMNNITRKFCMLHKNKIFDKFCNDCQKPLCTICTIQMHQSHSIETLSFKNKKLYGEAVNFLNSIKQQIVSNQKTQQMIDKQKKQFEMNTNDIISEVSNFFLELHSALQNAERNAMLTIRDKMFTSKIKLDTSSDLNSKQNQILCKNKEVLQSVVNNKPDSVYILDVFHKVKQSLLTMPNLSENINLIETKPVRIIKNDNILKDLHQILQITNNISSTKPAADTRENSNFDSNNRRQNSTNDDINDIRILNESPISPVKTESVQRNPVIASQNKSDVYVDTGVVRNVTNSLKLFIKFEKSDNNLREMNNSYMKRNLKECKEPEKIINGNMYLVNHFMEDGWVRAVVIKPVSNEKYLVNLIDYGIHLTIAKTGFRRIPDYLKTKPAACVKCEIFAIKPKKVYSLLNEATFVKDLIRNQTAKIIVIDNNQSEKIVDVILTRGKYSFSLRDSLIYTGHAYDNLPVKFDNNMAERMNTYNKIKNTFNPTVKESFFKPNIKKHELIDVELLHIVNPMEFYVGKSEHFDLHNILSLELNEFYAKKREKIYMAQINMSCAVCVNGLWNRAIIEEIQNDGYVIVRFVDIGKSSRVPWNQLLVLDDKFLTLDCYAFQCCLSNIDTYTKWTQLSLDKFKQIVENSKLRISVQNVNDVRCEVILSTFEDDKQVIVNNLLIENNEVISCCEPSSEKRNKTNKGKKVKMLHIESPSNFYIQLVDDNSDFTKLHRDIQNYMNEKQNQNQTIDANNKKWKMYDRCLVKILLQNRNQPFWYRGIIQGTSTTCTQNEFDNLEETYKIFLEDHGFIVQNITQLNITSNIVFENYKPGAIRCDLSSVKPTGGLEMWTKTSIDRFTSIVNTFSALFIAGDFIQHVNKQDTTSVFLWGLSIENVDPLAPDVYNYININQLLVDEGLAHLTGRINTAKNDLYEQKDIYNENINHWLSTQIENVHKIVDGSIMDTNNDDIIDTDDYPNFDLNYLNLKVNSDEIFETWLPPIPITKTIFNAYATYVDHDGLIYLHESSAQLFLKKMCANINEMYGNSKPSQNVNWHSGQACLCRFALDNNFYRAVILQIYANETIEVRFVDYGNIETCHISDLRNIISYPKIPIQANQYILEDISPLGGAKTYSQKALDAMHSSIVGPLCNVHVCVADIDKRIKRCSIIFGEHELCEVLYINGLVEYTGKEPTKMLALKRTHDEIVKKEQIKTELQVSSSVLELDKLSLNTEEVNKSYESNNDNNTNSNCNDITSNYNIDLYSQADVESQISCFSPLEESTLVTHIEGLDMFNEYKLPSETKSFFCKVLFVRSPIVIYVYPLLSEHINACANLEHLIQSIAPTSPPLTELETNTPCLSYFNSKLLWYRAVIQNSTENSRRVIVRYVDILITEEVDINQLRQCSNELMEIPLLPLRVNLYGISPTSTYRCKDIRKELISVLLDENLHLRIIETEPKLQVKLYRRPTDVVDIIAPLIKNNFYSLND